MQPAWTTSDLLPHVCGHITDVHCLAALSAVNKALNHYLFSSTGGKHWVRAGKLVCGEDYWPKDDESIRLENSLYFARTLTYRKYGNLQQQHILQ